ncbi:DUF4314 domain-containing protein [Parablautia muri]|uniref:DUF4314 domain-containing protein n=1 Tax=Parablautia muri TaxID=2320879 RepID=A0A9X5BMA2_9FIRM|nr:DUF4314 domain-containing protein [Parablautia muri]NBJ95317.1 DUF4314 domain-containing protein [Parablautia muri]
MSRFVTADKIESVTAHEVINMDDTASIMVRWDNGSRLHVVYGEDACRKLP